MHVSRTHRGDPGEDAGTKLDTGGNAGTGVMMLSHDQQSPEEIWAKAQTEIEPASRIRMYRKIINRFPDHEHAPEALFMVGFIYSEELGKEDLATKTFEELIKRYPDHTIAETAKWMLDNMNKPLPVMEPLDDIDDRPDTGGANDSL